MKERLYVILCLLTAALVQANAQRDTLTKWDFVLPEVEVKSQKIYATGDTINYNVSSFMSANDQTIGEVLKKLPGISVSELGQISYKGMPIKNFYIEGLDMLKGRYGIATNNLDPRQISTVQILENHQDVKALKGLQPEEKASINLKLRSGVKGVFNLIASLGAGADDKALWNNSLIATYFRRNSQLFATYKGNNTGEDLSRELHSFDSGNAAQTSALTTISLPQPPGLSKEKYYFNRSHAATYNNAYRIGQSDELGVNAAYWNDRDERSCHIQSSHLLPSGVQSKTDERSTGSIRSQMAYGDLQYLHNTDLRYLKEQMSFEYVADRSHSTIETGEHISQQGRMEAWRIDNELHLILRTSKDGGHEILSTLNAEKRPHRLSVTPNLFPTLYPLDSLRQTAHRNNFTTRNSVRMLSAIVLGPLKLHPTFLFNYQHDELTSQLANQANNLRLDKMEAGAALSAYAKFWRLEINMCLPVVFQHFELRQTDRQDGLVSEPYAKLSYRLNGSNELRLSAGLSNATPAIDQLYSQYILTSYRQLSAYITQDLFISRLQYATLSYDLKDILAMRFIGIDLHYNHHRPKVLYGNAYDGLCERVITRRTDETSEMISVGIRGSQGFYWKRLNVGLECTYAFSDSPLLVQDEVVRYRSRSLRANANLSLTPFKWLTFSYEGKYGQQQTRSTLPSGSSANEMPTIRSLINQCRADFMLPHNIRLAATLYHYYNSLNDGDKSFLLADAEANYTYRHIRFSLQFNNLLNCRQYLHSSVSDLSSYVSAYDIRPRSILLKVRFKIL